MTIIVGYDCTHDEIHTVPRGAQLAGYTTGSGGIPWTDADWQAHPGAIRIDQDPVASDPTADVLDVESGAATPADCPGWVKRAIKDFDAVTRPGQRWPCIYTSESNITAVANALVAGGVRSGVFLWVANWSLSSSQAIALITSAGGPFPIAGVQFKSNSTFDTDVWGAAWVNKVSRKQPTGPFPHYTTAGQTLGGVAATRGMNVISWLDLQKTLHPLDAANLAGNAAAADHSRWWSVQP